MFYRIITYMTSVAVMNTKNEFFERPFLSCQHKKTWMMFLQQQEIQKISIVQHQKEIEHERLNMRPDQALWGSMIDEDQKDVTRPVNPEVRSEDKRRGGVDCLG